MKYSATAKVYNFVFSKILKSYYKKNYPGVELKPVIKNLKNEYRAMIERTEGIGGKSNSMEPNLIGACWFFALAKTMPGMTPELLNEIVEAGFNSDIMKKLHNGSKKKGTMFSDKVQDRKVLESKISQDSDYEMDWKYDYIKKDNEFFYTVTKCGVCRLAEKENMKKFLPCMCHMDFSKFEMQGGKLYRTKTLANGDDCCDFHVVRIKY